MGPRRRLRAHRPTGTQNAAPPRSDANVLAVPSPVDRLLALQREILLAVRTAQHRHGRDELSRVARTGEGDTIFAIDVHAEEILLTQCEHWGRDEPILLIAEGLPAAGVEFGRGAPRWRLIVDPIDGTRPLMHDKRSAWSLAALAPERGEATSLADVVAATMTELPTTWQDTVTRLWATRGTPTQGDRITLATGAGTAIRVQPSRADDLRFGFVASSNFFLGTKELIARVEDAIYTRHLRHDAPWQAELYVDQYLSSGGQLAELALGRDRFALDIRPLAHRALGHAAALCSHPYDLCTALVAEAAGCVLTAPGGTPLAPPLQLEGDVAWVGYANATLAARLQPIVREVLLEHGLLRAAP